MALVSKAPPASSAKVRARMQRQPNANTACELALRSEVHRRGLRYATDARPLAAFRRRADLVFRSARVAVFVHGCFWHGCVRHGSAPRANAAWWLEKLTRTRARDAETARVLRASGWLVITVWEHDDPAKAAARVARAVRSRRLQYADPPISSHPE